MIPNSIKEMLIAKAGQYEQLDFIAKDPISIPHQFSLKQDIEIAGFFAATLAWGNRTTIINNCKRLLEWMDNAPFEFVTQHEEADLKPFLKFAHRTFNGIDALYFIEFLQYYYSNNTSLEQAFFYKKGIAVKSALAHFHQLFMSLPTAPLRTRKHVSNPLKGSSCKRLNMYLRWLVRKGSCVDFGLWDSVDTAQLKVPLDVHTGNVARRLGLLERKANDWKSVDLLTEALKLVQPEDPVRLDYALFALGVEEKYK